MLDVMHRRSDAVRAAVLLATGAYVVHALRYLLLFGAGAPHELALTGHGYLGGVRAVLVGLLAVAGGQVVAQLARGRRAPARRRGGSAPGAWAAAFVSLLAIFVVQESAEAALGAGHPGHPGAGAGLWLTVLLAAAVAALVVGVQRAACAALQAPAGGVAPPRLRWAVAPAVAAGAPAWLRPAPGRRRPSGRAPPLARA
jgi:hypothetical protein